MPIRCRYMLIAAMLFALSACATAKEPGVAVRGSSASHQAEAAKPDTAKSTDKRGDAKRGEKVDHLCFVSRISGFRTPDEDSVIVSRGRDDYLIETFGWCPDLEFAHSLAFKPFGSCLGRGDVLIAFDSPFGPRAHRRFGWRAYGRDYRSCRIKAIYKWRQDTVSDRKEAGCSRKAEAGQKNEMGEDTG